jgi:ATP-binding cassette subfamily C (CFTR/MRP) protein 1
LTKATVPSAVVSFLVAITILFLSTLEDDRSIRPSVLLNVYLIISLVFDAVQVRTLCLRKDDPTILGLFSANIGIKVILLFLESRSKRGYLRAPFNGYSPEVMSGFFSKSFFWWLSPILATGFRRILTLDDLFKPDESISSQVLSKKMHESWSRCLLCLSGVFTY